MTASCVPADEEEGACVNLSGSVSLGLLFPTRLPSVFAVTQEPLAGVFMGEGSRSRTECNLVRPSHLGESHPQNLAQSAPGRRSQGRSRSHLLHSSTALGPGMECVVL